MRLSPMSPGTSGPRQAPRPRIHAPGGAPGRGMALAMPGPDLPPPTTKESAMTRPAWHRLFLAGLAGAALLALGAPPARAADQADPEFSGLLAPDTDDDFMDYTDDACIENGEA